MNLIRPNRIGRRWLGLPISTPKALFNNSENGVFLDFSDPRSLYTDASGTIPVAAPGDTIRLAADKSRVRSPITAYAAVQANSALAPRWGRAPKSRRQLLLQSANFASNPWVSSAGFTATGGQPDPDGGNTAWLISHSALGQVTQSVVAPPAPILTYKFQVRAGAIGVPTMMFFVRNGTTATNLVTATITWATNTVVFSGAYGSGVASAPDANGWVTITISVTSGFTAGDSLVVYVASVGNPTPSNFYIAKNPQLEVGSVATAAQETTTAYDMTEAGVPSFGYARLDKTDDVLSTVLTLAQTGDVLLFGRDGSWIEPGRVFGAGAALALGPTGTMITANILRVIGDLVGIVAIGRPLTTDERNRALRYFQAAGAAGFLNAGADEVANGAFASDTIWTKGPGWTIGGGVATHAPGTGSDIEQAGRLVAGQLYLLSVHVVAVRATSLLYVHDGSGYLEVGGTPSLTPRVYQAVFRATASGPLRIRLGSLADADIDDVTLQPLTVGA